MWSSRCWVLTEVSPCCTYVQCLAGTLEDPGPVLLPRALPTSCPSPQHSSCVSSSWAPLLVGLSPTAQDPHPLFPSLVGRLCPFCQLPPECDVQWSCGSLSVLVVLGVGGAEASAVSPGPSGLRGTRGLLLRPAECAGAGAGCWGSPARLLPGRRGLRGWLLTLLTLLCLTVL